MKLWPGILALLLAICAHAQEEQELQTGISLTKQGHFADALPHFLAARGHVRDAFALDFNTALCYVGTRQYPPAIEILTRLAESEHAAQANNLLAQALIGNHQPDDAVRAFERATLIAPIDEKLYLFFAEAAADEGFYEVGLRAVAEGLQKLANSPKLLFERGMLRVRMEQPKLATEDFELVRKLAPDSDISFIAATQQALLAGNIQAAIKNARDGIAKGHNHYLLLTMLGEALLRSGITPASEEFAEAQSALETAVLARPGYAGAHIALGRIYLSQQRTSDAISQLETARQIDARNRALYPTLAAAWRRAGNPDKAQQAIAALAELNRQEAARIGASDGGHASYTVH